MQPVLRPVRPGGRPEVTFPIHQYKSPANSQFKASTLQAQRFIGRNRNLIFKGIPHEHPRPYRDHEHPRPYRDHEHPRPYRDQLNKEKDEDEEKEKDEKDKKKDEEDKKKDEEDKKKDEEDKKDEDEKKFKMKADTRRKPIG